MPRKLLLPVLVLLSGLTSSASAAYPFFGSKETVRILATTNISGQNGVNLSLGRKITLKAFILPYNIEDGDYVLVAPDDPKIYFPMPSGAKLATLQANGFLPKPLPAVKLKLSDYLAGYALWWVLLLIILLPLLVGKLRERREEDAELD